MDREKSKGAQGPNISVNGKGRLQVLEGRDPEQRWTRSWDGQWRMVLFDMPLGKDAQRRRLWSYLRKKGFGYLQNSVWITPDPLEEEREILASESINVESLILLDARPCAGETNEQIMAGAWDLNGSTIATLVI